MAYIKTVTDEIGKKVVLTKKIKSCAGYFEVGSAVTITGIDDNRGYEFTDDEGNRIGEAGWGGFVDYIQS